MDSFDRPRGDLGTVKLILRALFGGERDELAERLILRFGSLGGITDATAPELTEAGLTERAAAFFKFAAPFMRMARLRGVPAHLRVDEAHAVEFASRFFVNAGKPCDYLFVAGEDGTVVYSEKLTGDPVRAVIGIACGQIANDVMWIACKPHETELFPSVNRLRETLRAARAFDKLNINFIDYIEYGAGENYSLRRAVSEFASGKRCDKPVDYAPDPEFIDKLEKYIEKICSDD